MSDWVRFHAELTQGAKRALTRAARFVYMELSQRARKRRGEIVLTPGLPDVDAVLDLLGGEKREISDALKKLTSVLPGDEEPMVRVEDRAGCRVLIVSRWEKWNPVDKTASTRKARQRSGVTAAAGHGDVTRDMGVTETVTEASGHGDVTYPRAHALISPLSITDHPEADLGSLVPDVLRATARPLDMLGATFLGAEWAAGVAEAVGGRPQPPTGGELRLFAELAARQVSGVADDDRGAFYRRDGATFGRWCKERGALPSMLKYKDWVRFNRPSSGTFAKEPAMRPPPEHVPHKPTMSRAETKATATTFMARVNAAVAAAAAPTPPPDPPDASTGQP